MISTYSKLGVQFLRFPAAERNVTDGDRLFNMAIECKIKVGSNAAPQQVGEPFIDQFYAFAVAEWFNLIPLDVRPPLVGL